MEYPKLSEPSSFNVVGDQLLVSDPCYSGDAIIDSVKPGQWNAGVLKSDEGAWGIRVAELIAVHADYQFESVLSGVPKLDWVRNGSVGVDSGQMSITEAGKLSGQDGHEEWYEMVCDITLDKSQWGVLPNGVVSSSGYGDGGYGVYIAENDKGETIGVAVVFISDDEDVDDPDNDEPCDEEDELLPRPDIDLEEEELD